MTNASQPVNQLVVSALRLLCFVALSVSVYLLYGSLTGERLAGCGALSGCDAVLRSRWSSFFGVPVSLPAVLLYIFILSATFALASRVAQTFLLLSAGVLIAAGAWFIGLQLLLIRAVCPFCMIAHGCGILAGLLILFTFRNRPSTLQLPPPSDDLPQAALRTKEFPQAPSSRRVDLPRVLSARRVELPRDRFCLAAIGVIPVLILAAGQSLYRPKTYAVQPSENLTARAAPRFVELHDGLFRIDLSDTPMLGSPQASNIVIHLFDYTCPHCRELHPILQEVVRALSNQVAFASLVVPLATNCNHVLKRRIDPHATACELAFAALAVWRTEPEKLHQLEDWIFSSPKPPSPAVVTARSQKLVGTNEFNQAVNSAWIQQHLTRNIDLYATNYYRLRKQTLPELMIGTNLVSGTVRNSDQLYRLLQQQYELQPPPSVGAKPAQQ